MSPAIVVILVATSMCAQSGREGAAAVGLPDAPSAILAGVQPETQADQQVGAQSGDQQSQQKEPNPNLGESSVPQQNSQRTPRAKEQPKRILWVIPNYRAVSSDANVPPLDFTGKFKLFRDDSFDYSTFIYVGALAGIGMAQRSVPEFGVGAKGYGRYYWHSFADQAIGNVFTEWLLAAAFKEDPRYFTLGHGSFFKRSGYALSRMVVTRTDSGNNSFNFAEIVGNGAAAGITGLYYPTNYRTWTKTGQRWAQQLALDAFFNVVKEFWPDIAHGVFRQKYTIEGDKNAPASHQ